MSTFLGVLLIIGFIAFTTYEIVGIVQAIKQRKKSKIQEKGDKKE